MAARVAASDLTTDIAIVTVPGLERSSVHWGRLDRSAEPIEWRAGGFPEAARQVDESMLEIAWGRLSPASAGSGGRLELTVESRDAKDAPDGDSGWSGISGGPLFCHDHLVGVVVADPSDFTEGLRAARVETMPPAVRAAAGEPELAEITTDGVKFDTTTPLGRWASIVAGLLEVRPPHYADAGERLGVDTARWPAHWVKLSLAGRLLGMSLPLACGPVCDLLEGMDADSLKRRLVDAILPLWVSPQAADQLRALLEEDVPVFVARVNKERSARELVRRAWHCDARRFRIIGTPGVAGEEQLDAFLDEVRGGLIGAWGGDDPEDDDGMLAVFVLLKSALDPQLTNIPAAAVAERWPSVRTLVYTGGDPQPLSAAIERARLIAAVTPADEQLADKHRNKLMGTIANG